MIQLNACGVRGKIEELQQLIDTQDIGIITLNETWLKPEHSLCIQGFQTFRYDRPNRQRGGVAILVRDDIPAWQVLAGDYTANEVIAVETVLGTQRLTVATIYCPPDQIPDRQAIRDLLANNHVLITGDFNSKHPALGCIGWNPNGPVLLDYIEEFDLCVHSRGEPTHTAWQGTSDQLDLVLTTPNASHLIDNVEVLDDIGSDHLPVLVTLDGLSPAQTLPAQALRYNLDQANWQEYRTKLDEFIEGVSQRLLTYTGQDLDRLYTELESAILRAVKETIPRCEPHRLKTWRMSPTILEAIKADVDTVVSGWKLDGHHSRLPTTGSEVEYDHSSPKPSRLAGKGSATTWKKLSMFRCRSSGSMCKHTSRVIGGNAGKSLASTSVGGWLPQMLRRQTPSLGAC